MSTPCPCGRDSYNSETYNSCYHCYLERRIEFLTCVWCGRWHSPKFASCFACRQAAGREEAGRDLRLVILGRDRFTCQSCGDTEGLMQIDHVKPCAADGTADPWNLQVLCTLCNRQKGATWWDGSYWSKRRQVLVHAYCTYLWEYLDPAEKARLDIEVREWLDGGFFVGEIVQSRRLTEDERDYLRWLGPLSQYPSTPIESLSAGPYSTGAEPGSRPRFAPYVATAPAMFDTDGPWPDGECRICEGWSWLSDEVGPVHRCCAKAEADGLTWCPACAK